MMDPNEIKSGQVFQLPDDNERIRYQSGRWERSIDAGKTYSYSPAMQEQNRADALAPESFRIEEIEYGKITTRLNKEERDRLAQEEEEDSRKPISKRNRLDVRNPFSLISAYSGEIDTDIDDALETGETGRIIESVRMILRGHLKGNPKYNAAAYVDKINRKVTSMAEQKDLEAPHLAGLFEYSRAVIIKEQIEELINSFDIIRFPEPELKNVTITSTPPPLNTPEPFGFDTYIIEKHREWLMPYLVKNYTEKMPREIVPLVYALEGLGWLMLDVDKCTQINLINALQNSFGNQLKDSALKTALHIYDPELKSPDFAKQQKIAQCKQALERALKHSQKPELPFF